MFLLIGAGMYIVPSVYISILADKQHFCLCLWLHLIYLLYASNYVHSYSYIYIYIYVHFSFFSGGLCIMHFKYNRNTESAMVALRCMYTCRCCRDFEELPDALLLLLEEAGGLPQQQQQRRSCCEAAITRCFLHSAVRGAALADSSSSNNDSSCSSNNTENGSSRKDIFSVQSAAAASKDAGMNCSSTISERDSSSMMNSSNSKNSSNGIAEHVPAAATTAAPVALSLLLERAVGSTMATAPVPVMQQLLQQLLLLPVDEGLIGFNAAAARFAAHLKASLYAAHLQKRRRKQGAP